MIRKHAGTLLKLGITLLGLLLVFSQVDFTRVWRDISQADLTWVLLGFGLVNGSLVVRAYRWQLLLLALGAPVRFGRLVGLYFAANFFNSVFPSGLTGDVIRAVEVAQEVPAGTAAGTVIVDRATGLMALFGLTLLALPFRPAGFPPALLWQIGLICAVGLAVGFVVLEGRLGRRFGRLVPRRLRPYWQKLDQVLIAVEAVGWRPVWAALAISVFFNLMQIGWWWAAGRALGYDVPVIYYFFSTPIMSLVTLLPSVGGLGVREFLAPLLFAPAGLTGFEAVALSLLVFAIERVSGLLGAPIYLYSIIRQQRARAKVDSG